MYKIPTFIPPNPWLPNLPDLNSADKAMTILEKYATIKFNAQCSDDHTAVARHNALMIRLLWQDYKMDITSKQNEYQQP